jgi:hypothetical protein
MKQINSELTTIYFKKIHNIFNVSNYYENLIQDKMFDIYVFTSLYYRNKTDLNLHVLINDLLTDYMFSCPLGIYGSDKDIVNFPIFKFNKNDLNAIDLKFLELDIVNLYGNSISTYDKEGKVLKTIIPKKMKEKYDDYYDFILYFNEEMTFFIIESLRTYHTIFLLNVMYEQNEKILDLIRHLLQTEPLELKTNFINMDILEKLEIKRNES